MPMIKLGLVRKAAAVLTKPSFFGDVRLAYSWSDDSVRNTVVNTTEDPT